MLKAGQPSVLYAALDWDVTIAFPLLNSRKLDEQRVVQNVPLMAYGFINNREAMAFLPPRAVFNLLKLCLDQIGLTLGMPNSFIKSAHFGLP